MVVLIYGTHKVSEPLAYEVGEKVLQRAPTIKGIENPHFETSDWICLFNQFCEGIKSGQLTEYQIHDLWWGFYPFAKGKEDITNKWANDVVRTHSGQAVYDLHNRFNAGALNRLSGISELIPQDSPTLKYRPNDRTLAVIELEVGPTNTYPANIELIRNLAQRYNLKVIYKKSTFRGMPGIIEIVLPDDLSKSVGVAPDNKEDLRKCLDSYLLEEGREERFVQEYGDKWQEALELDAIRVSSPFLIPDKTDPRYSEISDAVTEFLIEFLRLHK